MTLIRLKTSCYLPALLAVNVSPPALVPQTPYAVSEPDAATPCTTHQDGLRHRDRKPQLDRERKRKLPISITPLLPMASYANNYNNPPSLPNYMWLEAGTNFGTYDDGPPSQHSQTTSEHLARLLENASISWRSHNENISGTNCPLTNQVLLTDRRCAVSRRSSACSHSSGTPAAKPICDRSFPSSRSPASAKLVPIRNCPSPVRVDVDNGAAGRGYLYPVR